MLKDLRQIVQDVGAAPSFKAALDTIVSRVRTTLGTEVCSVYVVNRETGDFHFAANVGSRSDAVGRVVISPGEGLVGLVAERAEPINLDDAPQHPNFVYLPEIGDEAFHAFLGVPIIHHRRVLGVLIVRQRESRKYDEEEEAFLVTLSAQLAAVVAHAEASGDIRELSERLTGQQDTRFTGIAGSPGIGIGTAVVMHPGANLEGVPDKEAEDVTVELALFDRAIAQVRRDIHDVGRKLEATLAPEERALFDAYLHMLDDDALAEEVRDRIRRGQWAQGALRQVILEHTRAFERMEDSYLRERAADVRELGQRVLAYLRDMRRKRTRFPDDTILVGDELSAAMLGEIPTERLQGIVSLRGSSNSHVAILARALDIPAVMGAVDVPLYGVENRQLVVDGFYGSVVANPSRPVVDHYTALMEEEREFAEELEELRDLPCVTRDGQRIALWVNIGLVGEITRSLDRGAEGIGLFRTEVPFMTEDRFPTEEEQRAIYREHMAAFEPRPVTMRTLDIGGDKALSYFPISEDNPFLGWRGIRVTLDHPEIFISQVRAMVKANAGLEGILRIMLPMVSSLFEVREAVGPGRARAPGGRRGRLRGQAAAGRGDDRGAVRGLPGAPDRPAGGLPRGRLERPHAVHAGGGPQQRARRAALLGNPPRGPARDARSREGGPRGGEGHRHLRRTRRDPGRGRPVRGDGLRRAVDERDAPAEGQVGHPPRLPARLPPHPREGAAHGGRARHPRPAARGADGRRPRTRRAAPRGAGGGVTGGGVSATKAVAPRGR